MSHQITTVNMSDGSVQGHKAGCADLSRGSLKANKQEQYTMTVETKHQVWLDYNCDFLPECEGCDGHDEATGVCDHAYTIDWKPCADHVPAFAGFVEAPLVNTTTTVEVKRGPKWSYISVNGVQVMEVRTNLVDQVLATIDFS